VKYERYRRLALVTDLCVYATHIHSPWSSRVTSLGSQLRGGTFCCLLSGVGSQSGPVTNSCGIRVAIGSNCLNRNAVTFFGLALSQNIPPRTVARVLCGSFLRSLVDVFPGLQLPDLIAGANEIAKADAGERSWLASFDSGFFMSLSHVAQFSV